MSEFEQDAEIIFTWWIERGFALLPCQPDSKSLVTGFGVNLQRIYTIQEARSWFIERRANMAVISPPGALLFDFDNKDLYLAWCRSSEIASSTYTERTPRGGARVVLWGEVSPHTQWTDGVELKRSALVSPSVVDGRHYLRLKKCGDILRADDLAIFSSLVIPGTQTPYKRAAVRKHTEQIAGVIDRIKSEIEILPFIQEHAPKTFESLRGRGRFLSGVCPLHDDKNPSFWVDIESNRWGCHGCKKQGDVIDLYAELRGMPLRDAIRQLSRGNR